MQTEDKGLSRPVILSLVYDGGTILASKRQPYDDLLEGDIDEKVLAARLLRQHKLICAAIKAGRIDDLRKMSDREPVAGADEASDTASSEDAKIPKPINGYHPEPFVEEPIIEAAALLDEVVFPDEAIRIVSELSGRDRPQNNKLSLELLTDARFRGGDNKTITLMVCRGSERKVVGGAQVMVKLLGSAFRPVIYHALTNQNGLADVPLEVPKFNRGRAAVMVRVISDGEELELRRAIDHG
ncbi:MAG: hypothetical protein LC734_08175 [Acidobacteria bacterium]|nr:hypothetical protein [Acidobacteriota bacterium]